MDKARMASVDSPQAVCKCKETAGLKPCRSCIRRAVANRPEVQAKRRAAYALKYPAGTRAHDKRNKEKFPFPCADCGKIRMYTWWKGHKPIAERCQSCATKKVIADGGGAWITKSASVAPRTKEQLKKISERGAKQRGQLGSAWKGGVSTANQIARKRAEYRAWRTEVFSRDNHTCYICKVRGGELNAHHIKPFSEYPELRYELSNGISLCVDCHLQLVHKGNVRRPGISLDEINFLANGPVAIDWVALKLSA